MGSKIGSYWSPLDHVSPSTTKVEWNVLCSKTIIKMASSGSKMARLWPLELLLCRKCRSAGPYHLPSTSTCEQSRWSFPKVPLDADMPRLCHLLIPSSWSAEKSSARFEHWLTLLFSSGSTDSTVFICFPVSLWKLSLRRSLLESQHRGALTEIGDALGNSCSVPWPLEQYRVSNILFWISLASFWLQNK